MHILVKILRNGYLRISSSDSTSQLLGSSICFAKLIEAYIIVALTSNIAEWFRGNECSNVIKSIMTDIRVIPYDRF